MTTTAPATTTSDPLPDEDTPSVEERFGVWPDLSFHYGLSFRELWDMPRALRELYVFNLPRLKAEQQQLIADASAYPHMDRNGQRAFVRRIDIQTRRFFQEQEEAARETPKDEGEMAERQRMAQIGFQLVDKDGNPADPPAGESE